VLIYTCKLRAFALLLSKLVGNLSSYRISLSSYESSKLNLPQAYRLKAVVAYNIW